MSSTTATPAAADAPEVVETRFGPVAVGDAAILDFPRGLPGFAGERRFLFAAMPGAEATFQLLHGLDGEPVDLVVVPHASLATRVADVDIEAVRETLDIPPRDLLVLCIVTLPPRRSGQTARVNLRAPIFVDVTRRRAVQVVLSDAAYAFREPLRAA